MTDETQAAQRRDGRREKKKPYSPPRVLSRERLEAIAGTCSGTGKTNSGQCPIGPIAS